MCACVLYLCFGEAAAQLRRLLKILARCIHIVLLPVEHATLAQRGAFRARLLGAQFNRMRQFDECLC